MSLTELEAADRGLRAMPERLENMSGICAVLNGLVLTEIKARCAHKEWTPWLKANYGKTIRDAQFRMQLAQAFSKSETRFVFEPQQLTLALLDDTAAQSLDLAHPVVKGVAEWTNGRSYRQLIADEAPAKLKGGARPRAAKLSPEEEHEATLAALREDATQPFKLMSTMGESWKVFTDVEIENAVDIAESKIAEMRAWLKTPKAKRPVLDAVKILMGEK